MSLAGTKRTGEECHRSACASLTRLNNGSVIFSEAATVHWFLDHSERQKSIWIKHVIDLCVAWTALNISCKEKEFQWSLTEKSPSSYRREVSGVTRNLWSPNIWRFTSMLPKLRIFSELHVTWPFPLENGAQVCMLMKCLRIHKSCSTQSDT